MACHVTRFVPIERAMFAGVASDPTTSPRFARFNLPRQLSSSSPLSLCSPPLYQRERETMENSLVAAAVGTAASSPTPRRRPVLVTRGGQLWPSPRGGGGGGGGREDQNLAWPGISSHRSIMALASIHRFYSTPEGSAESRLNKTPIAAFSSGAPEVFDEMSVSSWPSQWRP